MGIGGVEVGFGVAVGLAVGDGIADRIGVGDGEAGPTDAPAIGGVAVGLENSSLTVGDGVEPGADPGSDQSLTFSP